MTDNNTRLNRIFENSPRICIDDGSRIVMMSDCHRGDANWSDTFAKNQNIFFRALEYYYDEGYTYIELGDGDELWKNRQARIIKEQYTNIFWLLSRLYAERRLHILYGNHDMVKKYPEFLRYFENYFDEKKHCLVPLFPNLEVTEGLVLNYRKLRKSILLVHGHQGDLLNDRLWKVGRFLVRWLWRPLEQFGVNDPTMAARNYRKKDETEQRLIDWSSKSGHMVIAGHTHRPVFPALGEPRYFNDGSCVHPRCITAIEIAGGNISLVKWHVNTMQNGTLFIDREVLAGPAALAAYLA